MLTNKEWAVLGMIYDCWYWYNIYVDDPVAYMEENGIPVEYHTYIQSVVQYMRENLSMEVVILEDGTIQVTTPQLRRFNIQQNEDVTEIVEQYKHRQLGWVDVIITPVPEGEERAIEMVARNLRVFGSDLKEMVTNARKS